jgi:hypothetical protein
MDLAAAGTSFDEMAQLQGNWQGQFHIEALRLTGLITVSGVTEVASARVEGFASGDEIDLSATTPDGQTGFFSGRVAQDELAGNYNLAGRKGTWTGKWALLPGKPAPEVAQAPLPLPGLSQLPAAAGVPTDPDDVWAKCNAG